MRRRVNSVVDPGVLFLGDCLRFSKTGATRSSGRVFFFSGGVDFSSVIICRVHQGYQHFFFLCSKEGVELDLL